MNVKATIAECQRLESCQPAAYDWSELEADLLAIEEARPISAATQAVLDELANLEVDLFSDEVASNDSGKVALERVPENRPELPEFYGLFAVPDDASGGVIFAPPHHHTEHPQQHHPIHPL